MTKPTLGTLAALSLAATLVARPTSDTATLWSLEKAYWEYVQANDLQKYRTLWHPDFLGWPSVSPQPLRKQNITDWIGSHTSKGESLQSYELERLTSEVIGNVATTTYRIRTTWVDKAGAGSTTVIRIIHTWVRGGDGGWQIVSGMSAPTDADGH